LGTIKTAIIYILAGIGGNIFSAVCNPGSPIGTVVKIGASSSLYGILGIILGYIIINWYGLKLIGQFLKCQLVSLIVFVIMFIIVFTSATANIDYFGHIGGFLTGLWLSAIH
jgi:membrane associated rhomboid family serine protease